MTTDAVQLTVVTESDPARRLRRRVLSVVAHVLLVGVSIAMLYPLLWLLASSFRPENEIFGAGSSLLPSECWSLDSYFRGWGGRRVRFSTFFAIPLIISVLMSCVVACISTVRGYGLEPGFVSIWMQSWGTSWVIAFPILIFVLPVVRRIVGTIVEQP